MPFHTPMDAATSNQSESNKFSLFSTNGTMSAMDLLTASVVSNADTRSAPVAPISSAPETTPTQSVMPSALFPLPTQPVNVSIDSPKTSTNSQTTVVQTPKIRSGKSLSPGRKQLKDASDPGGISGRLEYINGKLETPSIPSQSASPPRQPISPTQTSAPKPTASTGQSIPTVSAIPPAPTLPVSRSRSTSKDNISDDTNLKNSRNSEDKIQQSESTAPKHTRAKSIESTPHQAIPVPERPILTDAVPAVFSYHELTGIFRIEWLAFLLTWCFMFWFLTFCIILSTCGRPILVYSMEKNPAFFNYPYIIRLRGMLSVFLNWVAEDIKEVSLLISPEKPQTIAQQPLVPQPPAPKPPAPQPPASKPPAPPVPKLSRVNSQSYSPLGSPVQSGPSSPTTITATANSSSASSTPTVTTYTIPSKRNVPNPPPPGFPATPVSTLKNN
jgi:hypothetical protein